MDFQDSTSSSGLALSVPVADLTLDPANLKLHNERSITAIAASLRRFGQQKPVVVDSQGVVIAGNGTLMAARLLGLTHIDVVRSELVGVERIAYAIADNRTAELSEWDDPNLAAVLGEMPADVAEAAGYRASDISELKASLGSMEEDEVPVIEPSVVARSGELWTLGGHRLLCGDSTKAEDVQRVLAGELAALVATDPPYLVEYTGKRVNGRGKDWSSSYREVDIADAGVFFRAVFTNVVAALAPHAAVYCWHAHKRQAELARVWEELGILDHQQIVWVKPAAVFGSVFWPFRHEPCMMGWIAGSKPPHDCQNEFNSVWEIDWEGKSRVRGNEHPTQKPLEIFARPMRKHTKAGDVVFEPFSGSGSQLIAAERLQRRCRAIEIMPVFVDVAIKRWQNETGQLARLDGDGRTWSEIKLEREAQCQPSLSTPACRPDAQTSPDQPTAKSTKKKRDASSKLETGEPPKARRRRAATEQVGEDCVR